MFTHQNASLRRPLLIVSVALLAIGYAGHSTWVNWTGREKPNYYPTRDLNWRLISGSGRKQVHIRLDGAGFWLKAKTQILSSHAHILTEDASTDLRNLQTGGSIAISANAVAHFKNDSTLTLLSGVASVRGPVKVQLTTGLQTIEAGTTKTVAVVTSAATIETSIVDSLTPPVGSNIEIARSPMIDFNWANPGGSEETVLELARDPSFQSVLFSQKTGSKTVARLDFGDRGYGAWFARVRDRDQTLAVTSFQTFPKLAPEHLRRMGRRWLTWDDQGPASFYRVEMSKDARFSVVSQSKITRSKLFDLSVAPESGNQFVRVVAIDQNEKEYFGEVLPIEIPNREDLLQSRIEFGDSRLALFARGWRIQLNEMEAKRIREGYVILRESELRGIRASADLDEQIKSFPKKFIFEVAKDSAFSNPERVRPTQNGELLPPALPLGTIYARLREVEEDGVTLGSYGPPSKISTLMPAPRPSPLLNTKIIDNRVNLKWQFGFDAPGFEVQVRIPGATEQQLSSYRTQSRSKEIEVPETDLIEWSVFAVDEAGRPISVASPFQKMEKLKTPVRSLSQNNTEKEAARIQKENAIRELASINPSLIQLEQPSEDAVVVGGATQTKYGRLEWRDLMPANNVKTDAYLVEIATDGDFVNVIERASTSRMHYTLQGDLPEGALFWRVKKRKLEQWSPSRRFEIVYE